MKQRSLKQTMLLITFTLALAFLFWNFQWVLGGLKVAGSILAPFTIGLAMAFILNILMDLLEKPLKKAVPKFARPLALVLSLLLIVAVVLVLVFLIVPQIVLSFQMVAEQMPTYWDNALIWIVNMAERLNLDLQSLKSLQIDWVALSNGVVSFFQQYGSNLIGSTVQVTSSIATGFLNFFIGLIFAIYILLQKETLGRQSTRLIRACLPEKFATLLLKYCGTAAVIFRKFVTGQLVEAVIIGALCFLGMAIFGFPYAAMISALVGFTALIPIVGALIGFAVGAFLILMVSPAQAFWFIIFLFVLQQLEGNLIYPKVVGKSIGLPGLWVLFAVTVGGSLGGVMGMLIAVPTCSFLYCVLREFVQHRLDKPAESEDS